MSEAMLRDGVRLPTLDEGTRCITEAELRDGFDIIDLPLASGFLQDCRSYGSHLANS